MQPEAKVKMVGFRRLEGQQVQQQVKRLNFDQPKLNVVLIEVGGTQSEKCKLKECEKWVRGQEAIELWKVTKEEAFNQMYLQMMKQSRSVYFVSLTPINLLSQQPIHKAYQMLLESSDGTVSEVHEIAKDNIQRIKFIILKDEIDNIDKQNYFHAGVVLIAAQTSFIIDILQEQVEKVMKSKLKLYQSSSSINTEDVQNFAHQMEGKIGDGVKMGSPGKNTATNPELKAWKMMHNTPGVGSYNLSA